MLVLGVAPVVPCEPLGVAVPELVLDPGCEPVCVLGEADGDIVLDEEELEGAVVEFVCVLDDEELEGDVVVELVWPVLLVDVLLVVCAITHVAQRSSTNSNSVLLFIAVLRRIEVHSYPP